MERILRHPLVRMLFLVMLVWSLLSLVHRLFGSPALLVLVGLCAVTGLIAWMLRHDRGRLARLYGYPICRQWIQLTCWLSGAQPPVEGATSRDQPPDPLLLRSSGDFRTAFDDLRRVVRGHDAALQGILSVVRDQLVLRSRRREGVSTAPLASFLLIGEPGIGKRHLAVNVGDRLYRQPDQLVYSLREYTGDRGAERLFGSESAAGSLVTAVRKQPYRTIVLEDVDSASPAVSESLRRILATGRWMDAASRAPVTFQHCVFFLTTTCALAPLRRAKVKSPSDDDWRHDANGILAAQSELEPALLSALGELVLLDRPCAAVRAEVVLLLAERECGKYGVSLQYVDPQVLAMEVAEIPAERGFELVPARVERLLHRPLVRAAKTQSPRVSLRLQDAPRRNPSCASRH